MLRKFLSFPHFRSSLAIFGILCFTGVYFLAPVEVHANAAPLASVGWSIQVKTDTQIRLVREVVEARVEERQTFMRDVVDEGIREQEIHVTVDFFLVNEGPATELQFRFPVGYDRTPGNLRAYLINPDNSSTAEIPVTVRPDWFVCPMSFIAGEKKQLRVTYHLARTRNAFRYALQTGNVWKGNIGEAIFRIHFPACLLIQPVRAVPESYRFDGTTVSWELKDFKPDFDLNLQWDVRLRRLKSDRPMTNILQSEIPADLDALPCELSGGCLEDVHNDIATVKYDQTSIVFRSGEKVITVNSRQMQMDTPAIIQGRAVIIPTGLLRKLGFYHARYDAKTTTLIVTKHGINMDRRKEPQFAKWHRAQRRETLEEYREEIQKTEALPQKNGEQLFELGELYYYVGDLEKARGFFSDCAKQEKTGDLQKQARFWKACCLAGLYDFRGAVSCLEQVFATDEGELEETATFLAATWIVDFCDIYSLPATKNRLFRARELADQVYSKGKNQDLACKAGILMIRCAQEQGSEDLARKTLMTCLDRFPQNCDLMTLILAKGRENDQFDFELLTRYFPSRTETRKLLLEKLRQYESYMKPSELSAVHKKMRPWFERVLKATPSSEPGAEDFVRAASKLLGQPVLPISEEDELRPQANLEELNKVVWGPKENQEDLLNEYWRVVEAHEKVLRNYLKAGNCAKARRFYNQAKERFSSFPESWEKELLVAEGRPLEAIKLLQDSLREQSCWTVDFLELRDRWHAEIVELLLAAGQIREAKEWFHELFEKAQRQDRIFYLQYHISSQVFRAGSRVFLAENPKNPQGLVFSILADYMDLPPGDGWLKKLNSQIPRFEKLTARFPKEPMAWFALGEVWFAKNRMLYWNHRGNQGMQKTVDRHDQEKGLQNVFADLTHSGERVIFCFGKALALDPCHSLTLTTMIEGLDSKDLNPDIRSDFVPLIKAYLKKRPEDIAARWVLSSPDRGEKESESETARRIDLEALKSSLLKALKQGRATIHPEDRVFWGLARICKELKQKAPLPIIERFMKDSSSDSKEPYSPQEIAAAISFLEPEMQSVDEYDPFDTCLKLGHLYERVDKLREAARCYRLGLVLGYKNSLDSKQKELQKALKALPQKVLQDETED